MPRLAYFMLLGLLAAIGAGCGSGTVTTATPQTVVGTVAAPPAATVPPQYANGDAAAGKTIFTTKGCGSCHTLKDAGTTGTIGPNLDEAKPDLALIIDRVVNGKSPMPSFKGTLTPKQIADVAAYVHQATSG